MVDKIVPIKIEVNKQKKEVLPQTVPLSDDTWQRLAGIDKYKRDYWWYVNELGHRTYLKYRIDDDKDPLKKSFQYYSFASGKWYRKNVWAHLADQTDYKLQLYRINELLFKDPGTVHLNEGEKTCEAAQQKFPDMFFTTYGGASGYKKVDWSVLKGRKVFLHPDIESSDFSKTKYEELCLKLIDEHEIDAKVVPYPSYIEIVQMLRGAFKKNGWGLEDTIPEGLDIHKLIEKAYVPDPPPVIEKIQYTDIKKAKDDWVYVRGTGNSYYERKKRKLVEQSEVNNLFLRAKAEGGFQERTASEWFQKNNIRVADGLTYYPKATEYIYRDDSIYINKYIDPKHENLGDVTDIKEKLDWFFKLVNYTCSYEKYETDLLIKALACAAQYPEENRTWCILISSQQQGTGKGLLFQILHYLLEKRNCIPLDLPTLNNNFNGYMLQGNNVFVTEANNKGKEDAHTIGSLKNLLTEDYFQVELKGKERVTNICHYNLYLSSNEVKPYTVEPNDRRHFYIRHELLPLEDEFYEDILFNKIKPKDQKELKLVAHYLKYVYKISREECQKFYGKRPKTKWHPLLLQESLTGYMTELKYIYEDKLIPCLHWDLVNVNQIYAELRRFQYNDTGNRDYILSSLPTKDQIKKFLRSINAVSFRETAIEPKTDKNHKPRGHYWIIRNQNDWLEKNRDISIVNKHFNDPLTYQRAHRDSTANYKEDTNSTGLHIGDLLEQEKQSENLPF